MNVDFITAIKMFFANYANFKGRSTRAEYWWVVLFFVLLSAVLEFFGSFGSAVSGLVSLACLIPNLALSTRRLHDIGKSGWWVVAFFVIAIICSIWMGVSAGPLISKMLPGSSPMTPSEIEYMASSVGSAIVLPSIIIFAACIWWIVLMCKKSVPDNQYGPNPYSE